MTNPNNIARPVFRMLAGILAIIAWGTLVEMIWLNLLRDMPAHTRWMGYIGMTSFALTMTLAAVRKK
jgi:hypothetical protein